MIEKKYKRGLGVNNNMLKRIKSIIKNRYWDKLLELQYGRDIVVLFAGEYVENKKLDSVSVLDIGLGKATDILNIKDFLSLHNKNLQIYMYGLEFYEPNIVNAKKHGVSVCRFDLERDEMPFENASIDIIVMNQVLEHTKEWYFIFKEVNRVLKKDGICIIGLPNLVSWHERARLLLGKHPNCLDAKGPHIRGVVAKNFIEFVEQKGLFKSSKVHGRYFYGILNYKANLFFSKLFPTLCVSNFIVLTKIKDDDFSKILDDSFLETNFYRGK